MATQRLVIHERTGIILRLEGNSENEEEIIVTWEGDPISLESDGVTKYWKRGTTGRIPATTQDIIESGVGDVDRIAAKQAILNAITTLQSDAITTPKMKTLLAAWKTFLRDWTL